MIRNNLNVTLFLLIKNGGSWYRMISNYFIKISPFYFGCMSMINLSLGVRAVLRCGLTGRGISRPFFASLGRDAL